MKTKLLLFALSFLLIGIVFPIFAQDLIILKTGDEIESRVSEVGIDVIKY
jgi:hypothetical protein